MDREQLKLGQHLRQEIKARKAAEKSINDSLAAAAAAAAADVAALATKTEASLTKLTQTCERLDAEQQRARDQQAGLAGNCTALQQVRMITCCVQTSSCLSGTQVQQPDTSPIKVQGPCGMGLGNECAVTVTNQQ